MSDTVRWQILVVALAGLVNRHQLEVIDYLREENRVLKEHLDGRRLRLTDAHGERQMRRFKSAAHAQRFLSVHGLVQNLFRVGRHLLRAVTHRMLRTRSFGVWHEVTGAC